MTDRLNALLASLARPTFGRGVREVSAFRAIGAAGAYLGVAVGVAAALRLGLSLAVAGLACAAVAAAFFGYLGATRLFSRGPRMAQTDQLWLVLASLTALFLALREPVLPYLDAASLGIALFLAAGRVGCFFAGCCHGRPSSLGVSYGEESVRMGLAPDLVGLRLFPAPLVESAGHVGVFVGLLALLDRAAPGRAFLFFLVSHALLRFATEGIRGDRDRGFLGLTRARWMAAFQLAFAVALAERGAGPAAAGRLVALGAAAAVLLLVLVLRERKSPDRLLLSKAHLEELKALRERLETAAPWRLATGEAAPAAETTSRGISLAVSATGRGAALHVSLAPPIRGRDARLLCEVAARVFPEVEPSAARLSDGFVLHLALREPTRPSAGERENRAVPAGSTESLGRRLYVEVLRRRQEEEEEGARAIAASAGRAAEVPALASERAARFVRATR